jgi:threonine/homoserine/homoserine lactone efflux protein
MENVLAFVAAATALLVVPGPTNSLIATKGAMSGLRPTILVLPAELCGYMLAIFGWALGLGAVATAVPSVMLAAKVLAGAILIHSSYRLWRFGGNRLQRGHIGARDVFWVTLSNPKALVFALTIVPHLSRGDVQLALPYLCGLGAIIFTIGVGWTILGVVVARGFSSVLSTSTFARVGAVVIFGFAVGLISATVTPIVF